MKSIKWFSKIRVILATIIVALLFLVFSKESFAVVSTTLLNIPSAITTDPFTLTATISGAQAGTNYLRIDLYKDQTTNYFGETYNGSYWYTGSDNTQFLPITIVSGTAWTGTIQGRFGDYTTYTDYDGSGPYKLRLRRYTSSGSYTSSEANLTATTVTMNVPTMTPTPTPTIVPTATPTNPPPTSTPSPTPTKAPTPTSKTSPTASVSALASPTSSQSAEVLGSNINSNSTPSPFVTRVESMSINENNAKLFMGAGVILVSACAILLFRQLRT